MQNDMIKKTKDLRKYMDQEFRKSQINMQGMQHNLDTTNVNIMKQGQDLLDMSMSHAGLNSSAMKGHNPFTTGNISDFNQQSPDINMPIEIEGEQFILEINNIQNIEYIDLN